MHKSELNGTDSNYYIRATSFFNPSGTADDWFVFGPIDVPLGGGSSMEANMGIMPVEMVIVFWLMSLGVLRIILIMVEISCMRLLIMTLTFGDLIWTRKEVFLDPLNYGGKSLYFAFNQILMECR